MPEPVRASENIIDDAEILPPETELLGEIETERVTREKFRTRPRPAELRRDRHDDNPEDLEDLTNYEEPAISEFEMFLEQVDSGTKASVTVTRLPDAFEDRGVFTVPCRSTMTCDPVRLTEGMTPDDVYSIVKEREGSGGNFRFQLREGRGFTGTIWETILSNPKLVTKPIEQNPMPAPAALPAPKDPFDEIIAHAEKIRRFRDALGDSGNSNTAIAPAPPALDPMTILLAERLKEKPDLQDKVLDFIFSRENSSDDNGIAGVLKELIKNPEPIQKMLGGLMAGVAMARTNQLTPGTAAPPHQAPAAASNPADQAPQIPDELLDVFYVMVEDLTRDAPVYRSFKSVFDLANSDKRFESLPAQIINTPVEINLEQLADLADAPHITMVPNGPEWMGKLAQAIRERMTEVVAPPAPAENADAIEVSDGAA